jgi:hypothetical protein
VPASPVPNPGSKEAIALGCICPVLDNNHGKWKPWRGGWWILAECPIHVPLAPPDGGAPSQE